jgi:hypothetical protein
MRAGPLIRAPCAIACAVCGRVSYVVSVAVGVITAGSDSGKVRMSVRCPI